MKKYLAIVMTSIILLLLVLTGCSGGTSSSQTQDTSTSQASSASGDVSMASIGGSNDDLVGEGLGYDYGFGPIGFDLDTLVQRMGKDNLANLKIGVAVSQQSNNWQIMWADEFKRLADEYGFELVLLSADNDAIKESDNLKSLQNQQCDGIILYPYGTDSAAQTVNEVAQVIPIVTAIPIDGAEPYLTIDVSQKEKGMMIADKVAEDADGEEVNVMLMDWSEDMGILRDRIDGFCEQAEKYPNINVVDERRSGTSDGYLDVAKQALLANEDINCIVASYTAPMMGGYSAVEQLGRTDVKIYGVDADEVTLQLLEEGKISGLHVQWPQAQAYTCLFYLLRAINGDELPDKVWEAESYAMSYARQEDAEKILKILYPNA